MKKKVLLLGRSGSGKTSMRSIIFANYLAKETKHLGATIDVEHSNVRFLGNLVLNIWDCGGQESFMENYYISQRERIFSNVEVLIYVFDVESRGDALVKDFESYQMCLDAITENSPFAQIFCLIHKMDLIQEDQKEKVFLEHKRMITDTTKPVLFTCFKTSIWEDTLYRAWSDIVHQLIPNMQELERSLKFFADIIECEEVLLFERATFLIISSYARVENNNGQRFEKISNIIKGFKLSCSKIAAKFDTMEVRNSNFALFVEVLTTNTYIMVVMSDSETPTALVSMNIKNSRKYFEVLERENEMQTTIVKQH